MNDPYAKKFTISLDDDDAQPFQPYLVQVRRDWFIGEDSHCAKDESVDLEPMRSTSSPCRKGNT